MAVYYLKRFLLMGDFIVHLPSLLMVPQGSRPIKYIQQPCFSNQSAKIGVMLCFAYFLKISKPALKTPLWLPTFLFGEVEQRAFTDVGDVASPTSSCTVMWSV